MAKLLQWKPFCNHVRKENWILYISKKFWVSQTGYLFHSQRQHFQNYLHHPAMSFQRQLSHILCALTFGLFSSPEVWENHGTSKPLTILVVTFQTGNFTASHFPGVVLRQLKICFILKKHKKNKCLAAILKVHPPKFNSEFPLKIRGWETTFHLYKDPVTFQGRTVKNFGGGGKATPSSARSSNFLLAEE